MRKLPGRTAVCALVATALAIVLSNSASAEFREFSGKVSEISGDQMVIVNDRGDRVSFRRSAATTVTGVKSSWQAIEKGDWVSASWKMVDEPKVAYEVVVMPPKKKPQQ